MSLTFDCHLLWAHYASGFSGMALEVELPDESPFVHTVQYGGVYAVLPRVPLSPDEAATLVLSSKFQEWSYEREVRILYRDEWFPRGRPIRPVILPLTLLRRLDPSAQLAPGGVQA